MFDWHKNYATAQTKWKKAQILSIDSDQNEIIKKV